MQLTFQLLLTVRMVLAGVCGLAIGLERKNRAKEAGIRTHCVVALASALMMIISKYGFSDSLIEGLGMREADPSRIAAQVVSGIGFLGAGMIFVHRNTVTGLTTAAGIWATSGVGMAIGAGMYVVGVSAAVLIIIVQVLLHINSALTHTHQIKTLRISNVDADGYTAALTGRLTQMGVKVAGVRSEKNADGLKNYVFSIEIPYDIDNDQIMSAIDYACCIDVE